jgi:hypothetical protein
VEEAEVSAGVREAEGDWVEGVALAEVETAEAAEMAEAAMQGFRTQSSVIWSFTFKVSA